MILSLSSNETATKEVEIVADASEIDLTEADDGEVKFGHEVTARLTTRRVAEEFFASGRVETEATLRCARCLGKFETLLSAPIELVIHRVNAPARPGSDLEAYVEVSRGTSGFDVGPYAREALLLSLPDVPHCSKDCLGLCARCGANLNLKTCDCAASSTDSRWDGLKQTSTLKR